MSPLTEALQQVGRGQVTVKGHGNSRWASFMLMAMATAEYD